MADKKKTRVTVYDSKGNPSGPPKTKVKAPKLNGNGNGKKKTKVDNKKPKVKITPKIDKPTLTRSGGGSGGNGSKNSNGSGKKAGATKTTFRQRRLARLKKREAAAKNKGRKSRLTKRIGRVERRIKKKSK
tara:strand:- start:1080 stop:1472 length:393 start_codon:yes stop_codon:yes gene_type:complete